MIIGTGPYLFVSVDITQEITVVYKVCQGLAGSDSNQRPSDYEPDQL